jgi:hypothetical protein
MTKKADLPVILSKEMEEWLGFQNTLDVEDCHRLLSSQVEEFDYEEYQFYMGHLLNNLRNPSKKYEVLKLQWKFFTINEGWESPNLLKYWANSSSHPPQDGREWIDPIFNQNEMKEFCDHFSMEQFADYGFRKLTYRKLNEEGVIEIDWKNDPKNRPEVHKDDFLWDSGSSFDIEIIKKINDKVVKSKKIEVKGTPKDYVHFFLGSSEWEELLKSEPKKYQIYVVTKAETTVPCLKKYKDPLNSIKTNEFNYISKTEFSGPKIEPETIPQNESGERVV